MSNSIFIALVVFIFFLSSTLLEILLRVFWVGTRKKNFDELENWVKSGKCKLDFGEISEKFEAAHRALDVATRLTKTFSFLGGIVSSVLLYWLYS